MNTDNIDKYGHCVVCHKYLITKRVVDGQLIEMFLPIHDHANFMLNNGSNMKVCICKPCKETINLDDPDVHDQIMEACMKGWELEVKNLIADQAEPQWTEESGYAYLSDMAMFEIDCHADNLDKNVLANKSKELSNGFRESLTESLKEVKNESNRNS